MEQKIILGITHGDFNGIGYEVILKALSDPVILDFFTPIIYGSSKAAGYYRKMLDIQNLNLNIIGSVKELNHKRVNIINCVDENIKVEVGQSTPEAGEAAYIALERAVEDLKNGEIHALVTAPINKKNIQSEKFHFPGHTEYLAQHFGNTENALMLMVNDVMRIAVVTGHIPLREVPSALTSELVLKKLQILNHSLKEDFMVVRPRIAILGLNPHAGDDGLIGDEEKTILLPAMKEAEKAGIICVGPYPTDGFFGSGSFTKFDGILAMYHDQGLTPFKTISMDNGVNFTAGLPIIRTSPAHGTAYDIAGQNVASENSFRQALYLACDVYKNRELNHQLKSNQLKFESKEKENG
ncbi:MAG: 4-hydroxythreonine-4-phosphate dehydrogenase PdxA [Paludibacteraceae bacterium]|jgi:4-hydroxythreonine-4-phosphate dehydrogenase|nr:4-hydroxythreonine-4-phosphate dehydrogenase PdxA [Paludibacteraceae bacterium]OPZ03210.1 MAG: 4-hydroxythreonine-4-phosphate dehydrogenase 2 [Bacteroidetes bacterium ADurb.BinA395]MBP8966269.1 4-hydroxythreonine-4-phosphate dehydrogenase PdxA [Paludibacteraceae bacterium]HOF97981.1 4-hydroxythreonine-4-phosphate dehydrogenase PdxA [Paludibacteraceae bacterium]HOR38695.1 4-hydroxythreonine-4-phosphate dehydrogenase PdxA [Paludibacteraceae bacterium]